MNFNKLKQDINVVLVELQDKLIVFMQDELIESFFYLLKI